MTAFGTAARSAFVIAAAALTGVSGHYPASAAAPPDQVVLAPHRAVYQLTLLRSSGSRPIDGIRGRILYDFSGNSCEGYDLQFRQVSELDSGEGKSALSDLSTNTWEDGAAKKFRFNSENKLNQRSADVVDGNAERKADAVAVSLRKPSDKAFNIPADAVFPTEHMRKIIMAARAGQKIVELKVYDGSETGEKIYDTLTVIGRSIAPGERVPQDAAAKEPALAKLIRWPVTISYFEKTAKNAGSSEQTPVYSINFELYENGISRALTLDYTEFSISGELTSLVIKSAKSCP